MRVDESNSQDTRKNDKPQSLGDYAKETITPQDLGGFLKVYGAYSIFRSYIYKPCKNLAGRILDYLETDDPETKDERLAFDLLERLLVISQRSLESARSQNINRRNLVISLWNKKQNLSIKEKLIIQDVIKEMK